MRRMVLLIAAVAGACGSSSPKASTTYMTTPAQGAMTCRAWPTAAPSDRTKIASAILDEHGITVTITGEAAFVDDVDNECSKLPHSKVNSTEVATYLIKLHGSRYR